MSVQTPLRACVGDDFADRRNEREASYPAVVQSNSMLGGKWLYKLAPTPRIESMSDTFLFIIDRLSQRTKSST